MLGNVLGAHPKVQHIEEIPAPVRTGLPLGCLYCGDSTCPIWSESILELVRLNCGAFKRWCLSNKGWGIERVRALAMRKRDETLAPCAVHARIMAGRPNLTLAVDTSKDLEWAEWNARAPGVESKFIWLQRDLRAVVGSYIRKYGTSMNVQAEKIVSTAARTREYVANKPSQDVMVLHYEDLVLAPKTHCERLCAFLGLEFDVRMLAYYLYPSHLLGGNLGPIIESRTASGKSHEDLQKYTNAREYHTHGVPGFQLDERWKTELATATLSEFDKIGGEMNRTMGYR